VNLKLIAYKGNVKIRQKKDKNVFSFLNTKRLDLYGFKTNINNKKMISIQFTKFLFVLFVVLGLGIIQNTFATNVKLKVLDSKGNPISGVQIGIHKSNFGDVGKFYTNVNGEIAVDLENYTFQSAGYVFIARFAYSSSSFSKSITSADDGALIHTFQTESTVIINFQDDVIPEINFKLYPVPANTHLNVEVTFETKTDAIYQVIDITGRIVKNGIWKLNSCFNNNEIDIDDLDDGQYIFRLKSTDKVITEKFWVSNG